MTSRVQIICNPHSGSFSAARARRLGRAYAAAGYDPVFAESSPDHVYQPTPGFDRICISGGDGTVRHVLARLADEPHVPIIDIHPGGTINLIARERGMPREAKAFVAKALAQRGQRLHPVTINDTRFMACASIGPEARAVANVSLVLKRLIGRSAYGVSMVGAFLRWKRPQIRVRTVDGVFVCEAIYVANGRYFAGPWSFAPEARLDDPLLHVVALKTARRRDFVVFMLAVLMGRALRLSNVRFSATGSLVLVADDAHPIQADGDIVAYLPADIKVSSVPLPA